MKKVISLAVLTTLAGTILVAPIALAAQTKGTVTFEKSKEPLKVTDASDIKFGTVQISGDAATYQQVYDATDTYTDINGITKIAPLTVTTVDARGANDGWQLQAKLDGQFTNKANPADKLEYASVSIKPTSVQTNIADGDKRGIPTGIPTEFVNLANGSSPAKIVSANVNEGMGTWTTLFGDLVDNATAKKNSNVLLEVPAASKITHNATYETSITWSLIDGP